MSEASVCIIGCGIAGALIAEELTQSGSSVIMLDSGPRHFEIPDMHRYEKVRRGENPWNWEDPGRDQFEVDADRVSIHLNRNRIKAVGGTTLHWGGTTPRLQPSDFKMKCLFGLGRDWPIEYDQIEPYYCRAEQALGVAGEGCEKSPPRSKSFPLPRHPYSWCNDRLFQPALETLGMSASPMPLAINSRPYAGRPACVAFGTCDPMCPIGARYSALSHIRSAEDTGRLEIRASSHAVRLVLDGSRTVRFAKYVDEGGGINYCEADLFILAAGGVENARLLLLSEANYRLHENGLANASGMVGRNFMLHTGLDVFGQFREPTGPHRVGFRSMLSWDLYQHQTLPHTGNVQLRFDAGGEEPSDIAIAARKTGRDLMKHVAETYGFTGNIRIRGEILPDPSNHVTLSKTQTDKYGDPIPSLRMNIDSFALRSVARGRNKALDIFSVAGADDIRSREVHVVSNHLMGTTVMGAHPDSSVCDQYGRCHDLDNLFIAGSSLFPTGGCSQPTLTIAALSLRTADHIKSSFQQLE